MTYLDMAKSCQRLIGYIIIYSNYEFFSTETQTSKEVSNSRSGSTTVRFDGIILDVLNSTTIHVDWCPIHVSTNETLCGYKIRYAALDNSSYNEIFVPHGISSYTITGLRPNTEYDISVNAVDKRENVIQTCGWVRQKTYELEGNVLLVLKKSCKF